MTSGKRRKKSDLGSCVDKLKMDYCFIAVPLRAEGKFSHWVEI